LKSHHFVADVRVMLVHTECFMLVICFVAVHIGQDVSVAVSHWICVSEFEGYEILAVIFISIWCCWLGDRKSIQSV